VQRKCFDITGECQRSDKSTVNRAINKYVAWSWVIKANLDTICQAHKIPKIPETTGIFIFRARFLQCQMNRPVLMEKIAISGEITGVQN
jgi:hypothetical protein